MARDSQSAPCFSTAPFSHGSEMASVVVGEGTHQHIFTIHKQLLSTASEYFDRALNGKFQESSGTLKLLHHCPIAFGVVYQWLYAGKILTPAEFKNSELPELHYDPGPWHQTFWLRLFTIADETMVVPLKRFAYQQLTENFFGRSPSEMPDVSFLKELFSPDAPQLVLQEYMVQYAASAVASRSARDPAVWQAAFKEVPSYGVLVFHQVVEWSGGIDKKKIQHPLDNPELASEKVCSLT